MSYKHELDINGSAYKLGNVAESKFRDACFRKWGAYLGTAITPKQVADMMILMKVARNKNKSKADNYVDIVGYGACGYEIFKTAEKQK